MCLGKNVKGICTSSDSRSKGISYLVHYDVCGHMSEKNLGDNVYYVVISLEKHGSIS